jgi:hypothetical protein
MEAACDPAVYDPSVVEFALQMTQAMLKSKRLDKI